MTTTSAHTRRRHRRPALAMAVMLLAGLFIAADNTAIRAATPPVELVSVMAPASGNSTNPSISGDGSLVGFDFRDGFTEGQSSEVRNRPVPKTENMPLPAGGGGVSRTYLSRDGCQVGYVERNTPLNDAVGAAPYFGDAVYVLNRCTGTPPKQIYAQSRSDVTRGVFLGPLAISARGRYVAFGTDGLGTGFVVRVDRDGNGNGVLDDSLPVAVSSSPTNAFGPVSLGDESATGKVALTSASVVIRNPQVYLWDPTKAANDPARLTLVSAADGSTTTVGNLPGSQMPTMSPDGRYVAFASGSVNLGGAPPPKGSVQIYVRDVITNHTALVTRTAAGIGANLISVTPSINADGTQIAFGTTSTDLLAPPVGGTFVLGGTSHLSILVATSTSGLFSSVSFDRVTLKPNGDAVDPNSGDPAQLAFMLLDQPVISSNGRWVAFEASYNAELQSGGSSAAPTADTSPNVYVIGRPTTISVTPLDFGTVATGQTPVLTATVTNNGLSSFQPASISANGSFSVAAGGSCVLNAWLSPGQSCTVVVQFNASTAGPTAGTLTLSESGYAAISGQGSLAGIGQGPTVIIVTKPALSITPKPASFGTAVVGVPSATIDFVVTSIGTRSAPISEVSITGANPADFVVVLNSCAGGNIPPGFGCGISVAFNPTAGGVRTAVLKAGSSKASATSALDGVGIYQPKIRLLPNVVARGEVTIAAGEGFPINLGVQVHWEGSSQIFSGTADANGVVSIQIPVRPDENVGPRNFIALGQAGLYDPITTTGLIVDRSMQPPTSQNPALPNFPSLLIRG